jgi:hypothetical protein
MKNKLSIISTLLLIAIGLIFSAEACKKKTTTTDAPKTLTKSYLYDKLWYNKGGTVNHKFNTNGTYGTIGTWKWLNNSDSMEVKYNSGGIRQVWYFEWSIEHEFSAKPSKNSAYILFKDFSW